jgi:UDP-glucuronate decarboxylase
MHPNDGRVVSNFIIQALQNKDITVYGDGAQTRSFQFVDDLVEGMIRMMNVKDFIGPVNIGNPNEFTILELAQMVIKLTNSKSKIINQPLPQDDPMQRRPDISLAKQKLNNWTPNIKLQDGLVTTIAYFENLLKTNDERFLSK